MFKVMIINKKIDNKTVLEGINLEVSKGDFIYIYGANESGKSTLTDIIAGIDQNYNGTFVANYLDNTPDKITKITAKSVFLKNKTVLENLAIIDELNYLDTENVADVIEFLELKEISDNPIKSLSKYEQFKVALARTLLNGTKVLISDDPISQFDDQVKEDVLNLLTKLNRQGYTIIVTSKSKDENEIANKYLELKAGKVASYYENPGLGNVKKTSQINFKLKSTSKIVKLNMLQNKYQLLLMFLIITILALSIVGSQLPLKYLFDGATTGETSLVIAPKKNKSETVNLTYQEYLEMEEQFDNEFIINEYQGQIISINNQSVVTPILLDITSDIDVDEVAVNNSFKEQYLKNQEQFKITYENKNQEQNYDFNVSNIYETNYNVPTISFNPESVTGIADEFIQSVNIKVNSDRILQEISDQYGDDYQILEYKLEPTVNKTQFKYEVVAMIVISIFTLIAIIAVVGIYIHILKLRKNLFKIYIASGIKERKVRKILNYEVSRLIIVSLFVIIITSMIINNLIFEISSKIQLIEYGYILIIMSIIYIILRIIIRKKL